MVLAVAIGGPRKASTAPDIPILALEKFASRLQSNPQAK